jgi:hypothetical protein
MDVALLRRATPARTRQQSNAPGDPILQFRKLLKKNLRLMVSFSSFDGLLLQFARE